jgi:hypothetical protein
VLVALSAAVAGCGGGERQDAHEPSGTYKVEVLKAGFPTKQTLAAPEVMTIVVRNADTRTIPDVALTVDSFATVDQQAGLADPKRPVWVVDHGPEGGDTAYVDTWALGPLRAGQTKTFSWHVTAIKAGTHMVHWRVAAGLNGKAKAELAGGRIPQGNFSVDISGKPAQATVDPATGAVVRKR